MPAFLAVPGPFPCDLKGRFRAQAGERDIKGYESVSVHMAGALQGRVALSSTHLALEKAEDAVRQHFLSWSPKAVRPEHAKAASGRAVNSPSTEVVSPTRSVRYSEAVKVFLLVMGSTFFCRQ